MGVDKAAVLVTGASSGIGQAVSAQFRRQGARLLLTGRTTNLDTAQPGDLYVPGDLNDEAFVVALAGRAAESLGAVDVVVLNHGLQVSSPLTEMAYDDAKDVLHSNLLSAFLVMKHFAPLMPAAGGSFVCVSSRPGMVGKPEEVMYSAAKGGLIMLAKGAAIDVSDRRGAPDDCRDRGAVRAGEHLQIESRQSLQDDRLRVWQLEPELRVAMQCAAQIRKL